MSLLMPSVLELAKNSLNSEIKKNLREVYICNDTLIYEFDSIHCKMFFDLQKEKIKAFWENSIYPHSFKQVDCKILMPKTRIKG